MSSKNDFELMALIGKRGSIAFRLTVWYALLSFVLTASAGSILYWVLADRLRQEDDQWLAGRIAEVRGMLLLHSHDSAALQEEVYRETAMLPGSYLRVVDAQGCWRRPNIDPPCRSKYDPGRGAAFLSSSCG